MILRRNKPLRNLAIDMKDEVIGDWTVIGRAPSVRSAARWKCQHKCGGFLNIEGTVLRFKPPKYCDNCRPKKELRSP